MNVNARLFVRPHNRANIRVQTNDSHAHSSQLQPIANGQQIRTQLAFVCYVLEQVLHPDRLPGAV